MSPRPPQRLRQVGGQALRFGLVGIGATALHYAIYYALCPLMPAQQAYTIGYAVSFVVNFYLSARFTFRSHTSGRRFVGMAAAHGVNYLLHICLLTLFLWLGVPKAWAPLPVFAIAVPVNFVLVRLVFTRKKKGPKH